MMYRLANMKRRSDNLKPTKSGGRLKSIQADREAPAARRLIAGREMIYSAILTGGKSAEARARGHRRYQNGISWYFRR